MLTIQQKLNLARAVKATTGLSSANPLITEATQPWEEVAGVVGVKSGFGANGMNVGTDATPIVADGDAVTGDWDSAGPSAAYASGAWGNVRTDVDATNGNKQTSDSSPFVVSASDTYGGGTGDAIWKAFDSNTTGTYYLSDGAVSYPHWIKIDFGSGTPKTIGAYNFRGISASPDNTPKRWAFEGSNDDAAWTTLDDKTDQDYTFSPSEGPSPTYEIASPGSYRYYRLRGTLPRAGGFMQIANFGMYETSYPATNNLITSNNLLSGVTNLDPSSFVATDLSGTIAGDGKFLIDYAIDGGAMTGSPVEQSVFKALPTATFAGITSLVLQIQLVGTQKLVSASIAPIASGSLFLKTGAITMTVDGTDVIKLEADGDGVFADISADDITLTGGITESARTDADGTVAITASDKSIIRCSYTATGAVAVSLPHLADVADGRVFTIIDIGGLAGTNNITLTPYSGDTIIGDATYVMDSDNESVTLVANTTTNNWEAR